MYSIQLHYALKLNFSDKMKHLRDFLNKGKRHINTNIVTYIVLHMYISVSLYACLARAGNNILLFRVL